MEGITRLERAEEHFSNPENYEHLYARGEDDAELNPDATKIETDHFDVSKAECSGGDLDKIDAWTLLNLEQLDCGGDDNKEKCLCIVNFSLQAMVGNPLWVCQPCGHW